MLITKKQFDLLHTKVNNLQSQVTELTSQINQIKDIIGRNILNIDSVSNKVNIIHKKVFTTNDTAKKLFSKSLPSNIKKVLSCPSTVSNKQKQSQSSKLKNILNTSKVGQSKKFIIASSKNHGYTYSILTTIPYKIPGMTFTYKCMKDGKPAGKRNATHISIKRIK